MRVEVTAKALHFPAMCPCCGGHAEIEHPFFATRVTGTHVARLRTKSWPFPYCSTCAEHARLWPEPRDPQSALLGVATLGASIFVDYVLSESAKKSARARCKDSCVTPSFAVRFEGWKGSRQTFDFSSEAYAVAFALANARGLADVSPELAARMAQARQERQQALAAEQEEKHRRSVTMGRDRRQEIAAQGAVTERRIRKAVQVRKSG